MKPVEPPRRFEILDVPVDDVDLPVAIARIGQHLAGTDESLMHVVTVNPEFVIAARRNPEFHDALRRSAIATADGIGIILAARILGLPIRQRVTGVDLVEGLAATNLENARLFLLGAGEGVAAETANVLQQRYPGVEIAGTFAGSSKDAGYAEIRDRVAGSGATVLLVAFGHPAQDLWIDRHHDDLEAMGIRMATGIGGAFDYLSGRVPRAPAIMRRLGLEWLYRLIRQPHRWKRQLALPLFVILVLRARVRRNTVRHPESS
jgi:N-acetylglucosaminyldiphosphoundecaprenol N-acetyl-beta-D-mannosaminyltransferase